MSVSSSSDDDNFNVFEEAKLSRVLTEKQRKIVLLLNEIQDPKTVELIVKNTNEFIQFAIAQAVNRDKAMEKREKTLATRKRHKVEESEEKKKARVENARRQQHTQMNRNLQAKKTTGDVRHILKIMQLLLREKTILEAKGKNDLLPITILAAVVLRDEKRTNPNTEFSFDDAYTTVNYMIEQGEGKLVKGNYLSAHFVVQQWPEGLSFWTTGKDKREFQYNGKYGVRAVMSQTNFATLLRDLLLDIDFEELELAEIYAPNSSPMMIEGGREYGLRSYG